jgi:predicted nucleic acid-binding Zn ribbon protein
MQKLSPRRADERYYSPRKNLGKAGVILKQALKRKGLEEKIQKYGFVLHWSSIVGEEVAKWASPRSLSNGKLIVNVPCSMHAQEIAFQKELILRRLKDFLPPEERVQDIMFRVRGA